MEHLCFSRKNEGLLIDPNKDHGHEEEPPLFLHFPSPFFDDISATPILTNNHTHHHSSPNKPLNIIEPSHSPLPSESKRLKKRSVGKKDRHSKIHTAQGLRDRRMRLSLQIARKFFDLQDLLGFDKASKTIEWLFCKSNKAIKEVAERFNSQHSNQSLSEEIENMGFLLSEIEANTNKGKNSKDDEIKKSESRREQARGRARERTRERMMIKDLEKSKILFGGNPKDEISKLGLGLGLGYSGSPNNHNVEDLGYTSSPFESNQQDTSSPSIEHSSTHHLLRKLQIHNNAYSFENFSGGIVGSSTYCSMITNHNPPAGWLNSCNGLLGISGEWDADSFINECYNYGIVPGTAPLTGDIYEQNPSLFFMPTRPPPIQSQNQDK